MMRKKLYTIYSVSSHSGSFPVPLNTYVYDEKSFFGGLCLSFDELINELDNTRDFPLKYRIRIESKKTYKLHLNYIGETPYNIVYHDLITFFKEHLEIELIGSDFAAFSLPADNGKFNQIVIYNYCLPAYLQEKLFGRFSESYKYGEKSNTFQLLEPSHNYDAFYSPLPDKIKKRVMSNFILENVRKCRDLTSLVIKMIDSKI